MPAIVIDLTTFTATQGFIIQGDAAFDSAGCSVSNAGDVNGDGIDDLIVGAYGDDGGYNAGVAYVIFGRAGTTRANIDLGSLAATDRFIIQGDAADDLAGRSVSSAGDVNGDGIDDLILGALQGNNGGLYAGEAYVIFGKLGATRGNIDLTNLAASDGFIIQGDAAGDQAGFSVSDAGDINGDGIDDLIVGARGGDDGGSYAGEAYVIFGKAGATRANIDLTSLAATDGFIIQGDMDYDTVGYSVSSAGDINGDGIDDLSFGAPGGGNGSNLVGEAYVIFGKAGATRTNIDLTSLAATDGFIIQGNQAGTSVSNAGDINGDGLDDLIVGTRNPQAFEGRAYVIFGRASATRANIDVTNLSANDGFVLRCASPQDYAGLSVSNAGDIDGDGIDDLIVGQANNHAAGFSAGRAYVIFGKVGVTRADIQLDNLSERDGFVIEGDAELDNAGRSVSSAGDINDDGIDDLTVGAIGGDNGGNNAGEVYVIYGNAAYTSPAGTLNGTAAVNTLNGTTLADQIYGLDGDDTLWGGAGDDTLDGGEGDDLLDGGTGSNTLIGGNGTDALRVSASGTVASIGGFEALKLIGGANLTLTGTQFANGLASNTAVSGTGSITVNMDAGIDFLSQSFAFSGGGVTVTVNGTSGTDIIKCGTGVHTINAGDGVDQIRGGTSADIINGGAGDDKIIGFTGADIITGGTGNDQFRYMLQTDSGLGVNADRITDFTIGGDRLNFLFLDADVVTAGDQAFNFIGTAAFAATGIGQIRYQNSGADLLVQADVNGDGIVDMEIILQGLTGGTLTAGDFIL